MQIAAAYLVSAQRRALKEMPPISQTQHLLKTAFRVFRQGEHPQRGSRSLKLLHTGIFARTLFLLPFPSLKLNIFSMNFHFPFPKISLGTLML